jgi:DNA polymerase I-like protein with 3'-5' exonuclease and polymerase domains
MTPELHRLIILCGADLLGLVYMECAGFKYDSAASLRKAEDLKAQLKSMEDELLSYSEHPINFDSGDELSCFLFGGTIAEDVFKQVDKVYQSGPRKGEAYTRNEFVYTVTKTFNGHYKPLPRTEVKKSTNENKLYQTSDDVLLRLKARTKKQQRIIELLRARSKLEKLVGTYLTAIPALMETMHWGEYVHGQFNQVVARTGRLSSSKPNMQNASPEVDQFYVSRYAD